MNENQIVTVLLAIFGAIISGIASACGVAFGLVKFLLDIKIEKAIKKYDDDTIQKRCSDHKKAARSDLQEIKDSQNLARQEQKEHNYKLYTLIGSINDKLYELANIKANKGG